MSDMSDMSDMRPSGNNHAATVDVRLPRSGKTAKCIELATDFRNQFRASIGMTDGYLCGVGHQPIVWHCGILAKFIAAATAAAMHASQGRWVHFLSDQDVLDPLRIDLPVLDHSGAVRRSSLRLALEQPHLSADAVACARNTLIPRHFDEIALASDAAKAALDEIITALQDACDAPNAGVEMARAMNQCARRWVTEPHAIIESKTLLASDAGQAILNAILSRPQECAAIFNQSLAIDRRAARPLREDGVRSEVPVWGIGRDGSRQRIDAVEARRRQQANLPLLPRAFLASGLMRIACDLYFHGTGGIRYEQVGEIWWREFFGIELPPFASATATVFPTPSALGLPSIIHANQQPDWRRAWWNPALLNGEQSGRDGNADFSEHLQDPIRAELLAHIASAPRNSSARRAAYRALCDYIEKLRRQHAEKLAAIHAHELASAKSRAQSALTQDRTWPFLLTEHVAIDRMAQTIHARIKQDVLHLS